MREPRAGVAPPLCNSDAMGLSLDLEPVGVSSTSRRNWVLFMTCLSIDCRFSDIFCYGCMSMIVMPSQRNENGKCDSEKR